MLKEFCFFSEGFNRAINRSNVKELYSSINAKGYISEVSKIEYLSGSVIQDCKLFGLSVVPKVASKDISITNWDIKYVPVEWNPQLKVIVDGQHKVIAMELLELLESKQFDIDRIIKEATLPDYLSIPEFISIKNSGRPWVYKDFELTKISTGDVMVDKIIDTIKCESLLSQVGFDIFSLKTGALTNSLVKGLKAGTHSVPSSIILNADTFKESLRVLDALKASPFIDRERYNNTRFSKGLKRFIIKRDLSIDEVVDLIGKIDKVAWEKYFTSPIGSPEANFYMDGFDGFYRSLNL